VPSERDKKKHLNKTYELLKHQYYFIILLFIKNNVIKYTILLFFSKKGTSGKNIMFQKCPKKMNE
jgi:hypothetical protein